MPNDPKLATAKAQAEMLATKVPTMELVLLALHVHLVEVRNAPKVGLVFFACVLNVGIFETSSLTANKPGGQNLGGRCP